MNVDTNFKIRTLAPFQRNGKEPTLFQINKRIVYKKL